MKTRGFTLIELLTVISIIALLSTIVIQALNESRDKARVAAGQQVDASIKHAIGDRLVAEWTFDEESGANYYDSGPYGANGVQINSVSRIKGVFGNAANFGLSNYNNSIDINDGSKNIFSNFDTNSSFTLTAWFKNTTQSDVYFDVIFDTGARHSSTGLMLSIQNKNIRFDVGRATSDRGFFLIRSKNKYNDDKWHFIAISFNADKKYLRMYVDGKLEPVYNSGQSGTLDSTNTTLNFNGVSLNNLNMNAKAPGNNDATIGNFVDEDGHHVGFDGLIDQVRFYDKSFDDPDQ